MLFCGALFLRSLTNIRSVEKGFDSSGVLILNADASRARFEAAHLRVMYREAVARLQRLPGVRSASVSQLTPIWGGGSEGTMLVQKPGIATFHKANVSVNRISPGYFSTTGTSIYAGRDFSWRDSIDSPKVAIVNRTLADRYLDGTTAIGARVNLRGETFEIVGIAGDALYYGLRGSVPPTIYVAWHQLADRLLQEEAVRMAQFAIRADRPPLSLAEAARAALLEATPAMAITNVRTFEQQLDGSIARERILSILSGFFACLGLLLAAIGLYGVMGYTVARRTSEIGVRMALGAEATQIRGMVIREAVTLISAGVAVGLFAAVLLARTLETMLFGLTSNDPSTALAVAVVMMATGLAAAYFPSRRAARINPMLALRME